MLLTPRLGMRSRFPVESVTRGYMKIRVMREERTRELRRARPAPLPDLT